MPSEDPACRPIFGQHDSSHDLNRPAPTSLLGENSPQSSFDIQATESLL